MLAKYLEESLKSDNKDLCKGWDYLKNNITDELRAILDKKEYWDLFYNSQKIDFILKELKVELPEKLKRQLGSFVYIYNKKKREENKLKVEQEILNKGYVKIFSNQKELDGKKVRGIFKISKLGIMGSFDKLEEKEGTLRYSDAYNGLMLIPKRSRTRGHIIMDYAYIKSV